MQPWIAFADKSDNVRVWDWTTQQVSSWNDSRSLLITGYQQTFWSTQQ